MKVRIKRRPSGLYNGAAWAQVGEIVDLPDLVAESLLRDETVELVELEVETVTEPTPPADDAQTPAQAPGDVETATPPTGDAETATPPAGDVETATPPAGDTETATSRRPRKA